MRRFICQSILKCSALPTNVDIPIDADEEQIFRFLQAASNDIGSLTGKRPTVRVAGGWVRDKLLGKASKDIDLTVDTMPGDKFADLLYQIATQRYGKNQRVVTEAKNTEERPDQIKKLTVAFLRIFGQDVEILPLRGKEVYEEGSRNPVSTQAATPQEDAYRRDLTINSMFYNVNEERLEDFTGQGYDDLATMTLRHPSQPGHERLDEAHRILSEDPLRWLRYVRFLSRYQNAKLDPVLLEGMKNPKIQHQIVRRLQGDTTGGIVPERTAEELRKIMMGEQPEEAVKVMLETGLLQQILLLPEEYHPLDMDQKNKHHQLSVIAHTIEVLKNVNNLSKEFGIDDKQRMMMNLTAVFHDLGKLDPRSHKNQPDNSRGYSGDPTRSDAITHQQASQERWNAFAKALKLSDEESSWISNAVLSHMNPHAHIEDMGQPSDRQLRRYLRKNPEWVFQYIHAMADSMSKTEVPDPSKAGPYRENLERLRSLAPTADEFGNMQPAQDLLRGPEIIAIVGLPPRPPPGMTGYIEVVKEIVREQQDINPGFSAQEASTIVQTLTLQGQSGQGPLAPYFQNVV